MSKPAQAPDRTCKFAWASAGLGLLLLLVASLLARLATPVLIRISIFRGSATEVLAGAAAFFLLVGAFLHARLLLKLAACEASPHRPKYLVAGLCVAVTGLTVSALQVLSEARLWGAGEDVSILTPANDSERFQQVQVELQTLEGALVGYRMIHGKWPVPLQTDADTIVRVEAHQALVETVLKGIGPGTFAQVFIGMRPESFTQGKLLDPWGHPYHIVIDSNGDGACVTDGIGSIRGREAVAWSDGPGKVYLQNPPKQ